MSKTLSNSVKRRSLLSSKLNPPFRLELTPLEGTGYSTTIGCSAIGLAFFSGYSFYSGIIAVVTGAEIFNVGSGLISLVPNNDTSG